MIPLLACILLAFVLVVIGITVTGIWSITPLKEVIKISTLMGLALYFGIVLTILFSNHVYEYFGIM